MHSTPRGRGNNQREGRINADLLTPNDHHIARLLNAKFFSLFRQNPAKAAQLREAKRIERRNSLVSLERNYYNNNVEQLPAVLRFERKRGKSIHRSASFTRIKRDHCPRQRAKTSPSLMKDSFAGEKHDFDHLISKKYQSSCELGLENKLYNPERFRHNQVESIYSSSSIGIQGAQPVIGRQLLNTVLAESENRINRSNSQYKMERHFHSFESMRGSQIFSATDAIDP